MTTATILTGEDLSLALTDLLSAGQRLASLNATYRGLEDQEADESRLDAVQSRMDAEMATIRDLRRQTGHKGFPTQAEIDSASAPAGWGSID